MLKFGECFFCATPVTDEFFCHGCRVAICESCEVAFELVPIGAHVPEDHRQSWDDEDPDEPFEEENE